MITRYQVRSPNADSQVRNVVKLYLDLMTTHNMVLIQFSNQSLIVDRSQVGLLLVE